MVLCLIIGGDDLDLLKVVSVGLLCCKVTIFPLVINISEKIHCGYTYPVSP